MKQNTFHNRYEHVQGLISLRNDVADTLPAAGGII